jgi:PAS domain S-box-containing protein
MRALLAGPFSGARETLEATLRARGWEVGSVAELTSAELCMDARPVPLAVLDVGDATPRAVEVCRRVRRSPAGRNAHLIVFTTDYSDRALQALVEAGADNFLILPLSEEQLRARLTIAEHRARLTEGFSPTLGYHQQIQALQQNLGVQRAYLEELFESAPEGIAVIDGKDFVVRVNTEFCRMFGYAAPEALGQQINDLVAPRHLHSEAERLTRMAASGERVYIETQRRRSDGSLLDVSLLTAPIRLAEDQIGTYAIYRDITARRRAEEALRHSEERYRALFEQSPVGVFLYDRELRITHCNPSLLRILDVGPEQVIGRSLAEVGDSRVLPLVLAGSEGEPVSYEGPFRPSSREDDLWVSVQASPLRDGAGRVLGGIAVLEDVSERQRTQARLREQARELARVNEALRERTREAEAALQARNQLYTTMNHELRTPVSAIMLYNELLLGEVLGPLAAEQKDAVQHAQRAANHLLELVHDVLDLSKLEAGKVELHTTRVTLSELIDDLLSTVRPLAAQHSSALRVDVPAPGCAVVTDSRRVRQILLNLLANAVRFGEGKPVVIRAFERESGEVCVEVADQGIGIAPDDLPRVFEDFVQVGAPHESGTGLGLAISRRLAHRLGARLEAESAPGAGSTFRLVLPPHPPAPSGWGAPFPREVHDPV